MCLAGQISFLSQASIMNFGTEAQTSRTTHLGCLSHDCDTNRSILLPELLTDLKSGQIQWDKDPLSLGRLCFYDMLILHRLSFVSLGCFFLIKFNE
ncbi:hypothetical protein KDA_47520 [Dictyobacter alpinus]|uniref:Uncharacterized protein n=1 Tax=Dictyobacter alpinus TaxID=2014873 RepID=A0A402BCZ4_9CHLR|nr:hypothetical protein KDA_47520 [Dictyobacter alpinus]